MKENILPGIFSLWSYKRDKKMRGEELTANNQRERKELKKKVTWSAENCKKNQKKMRKRKLAAKSRRVSLQKKSVNTGEKKHCKSGAARESILELAGQLKMRRKKKQEKGSYQGEGAN